MRTSAEVKSEWSCTSIPSIGLYGMQRDSFTFLLCYIPALHVKCKKSTMGDTVFLYYKPFLFTPKLRKGK